MSTSDYAFVARALWVFIASILVLAAIVGCPWWFFAIMIFGGGIATALWAVAWYQRRAQDGNLRVGQQCHVVTADRLRLEGGGYGR